jgi:hypothetical protein
VQRRIPEELHWTPRGCGSSGKQKGAEKLFSHSLNKRTNYPRWREAASRRTSLRGSTLT